jgi:hypothetical protein
MLTCLYHAIAEVRKKHFPTPLVPPIDAVDESPRSACFLLLTDESIWTIDTLYYITYIINSEYQSHGYYDSWLADWNSNNTATNKPPFKRPTTFAEYADWCNYLNVSLKQMSYYYGITLTWGIYNELYCRNTYVSDYPTTGLQRGDIMSSYTNVYLPILWDFKKNGEYRYTNVKKQGWSVPQEFHV